MRTGRQADPDPESARPAGGAQGAVASTPSTASRRSTRCSTALANHPDFNTVNWKNLKVSVGGGMAVQGAVAKLWLDKTGCPICEGYGLSETSPSASCNPTTSKEYTGTIGVPLPSTYMKLLDDDGNEVPLGQPGEIAIKGPQVMAGYWQRPDETAKVMTPDGFFKTGDIGVHGRARLLQDRRPQEGHGPGQRLQRLPERGRGRGRAAARRAGMRRGRRARREDRRGRQAGDRQEGPGPDRGARCASTAAPTSPATSSPR